MSTIIELLETTADEYDTMVFQLFHEWAAQQAAKPNELQNIMANPAIAKWFRSDLSQLEEDFKDEIKQFQTEATITKLHLRRVYGICINRIFDLHPKPLLKEAKKVPLPCELILKYPVGAILNPLQAN
jgi:hypothetical protein